MRPKPPMHHHNLEDNHRGLLCQMRSRSSAYIGLTRTLRRHACAMQQLLVIAPTKLLGVRRKAGTSCPYVRLTMRLRPRASNSTVMHTKCTQHACQVALLSLLCGCRINEIFSYSPVSFTTLGTYLPPISRLFSAPSTTFLSLLELAIFMPSLHFPSHDSYFITSYHSKIIVIS